MFLAPLAPIATIGVVAMAPKPRACLIYDSLVMPPALGVVEFFGWGMLSLPEDTALDL